MLEVCPYRQARADTQYLHICENKKHSVLSRESYNCYHCRLSSTLMHSINAMGGLSDTVHVLTINVYLPVKRESVVQTLVLCLAKNKIAATAYEQTPP
jgi:hypothetical protein